MTLTDASYINNVLCPPPPSPLSKNKIIKKTIKQSSNILENKRVIWYLMFPFLRVGNVLQTHTR